MVGRHRVLRDGFVPTCMATALSLNGQFDATAFRSYLDRFLADAGGLHDPVERVLVEQMAFAHLRLADLHAQAATAKSVEATKGLTSAAARLLGKIRRVALALQIYRHETPATERANLRLAKTG